MGKVAIEGLAVLELLLLRNDDLILRDTVVGLVAIGGLDGTYPLIVLNHPVNGRKRELLAIGHRTYLSITFTQLLIELRPGFLQIGLVNIEDIIGIELRIDVVFASLFLAHLLVVIILDALLGL